MDLTLGFHGGAGTVTGSRFLVGAAGHRFLVDCGLFQGLKALRQLNWRPPAFNPRALDAVLLTHAHIDHSGYLPRLVHQGFRGPVYCTPATAELAEVLLVDAARIQEEDASYARKKGFARHDPPMPLFTERDAHAALRHLKPVDYGRWLELAGGTAVRFHNAGHILGSAAIEVRAPVHEGHATLLFSGDLGRYGVPLHVDPDPRPECDALILESTYGDRDHDTTPLARQLGRPFRETIARGGVILIPAFAVARVQLVALLLRDLMAAGEIPEVPVHLDSPMAVEVTRIYSQHLGSGELDAFPGAKAFFARNLKMHGTIEESRQIDQLEGPRIIISSSGMLTGGRVLHHLRRLMPDPSTLLVLVGYQAEGTRGRALLEGATSLRMHGQDVPVGCRLLAVDGLSAHADRGDIDRWVRSNPEPPTTIFLAHGEQQAAYALAKRFRDAGYHTLAPRMGQQFAYVPTSRRWREISPAS